VPGTPDPSDHRYSERLWPGATVWLLGVPTVVALAVAYGRALSPLAGWLVLAAGLVAFGFVYTRMAAPVVVDDSGVRAGPAVLPWSAIGRAVPLDADGARQARGPKGDPSAYLMLRPGVGPGAVVVEVTDPEDPHRTWLVASRNPTALASAIQRGRGRLAP
jgi:Protein of unknown function (DUF3093)